MAATYMPGSLKVDKSRDMLLEGYRPRIGWARREAEVRGREGEAEAEAEVEAGQ